MIRPLETSGRLRQKRVEDPKNLYLSFMSRKYKFWDNQRMYFISFATVNWIDVFTRNEYKDELIKSWHYCQEKKGLNIYAWCIMPSHIHMLIGSHDKPLEDIVRDMKSHTFTKIGKLIKQHSQESRCE